jgi:hypothetical protein
VNNNNSLSSVGRGLSITQFYTEFAGQHDEIVPEEVDAYQNPKGRNYDLGREGAFGQFSVLVGLFCGFNMDPNLFNKYAGDALSTKGFRVIVLTSEEEFILKLKDNTVDSAWIISGDKFSKSSANDTFGNALLDFHKSGRGLAIWGDNAPWQFHASLATEKLLGFKLIGNTPGGTTLKLGNGEVLGTFKRHLLTSGIQNLFEGITICYPSAQVGNITNLATSSNLHVCMACVDHNQLPSPTYGRILVDCGFTKLYCNWDTAGTERYVRNVAVWLLSLDHRFKMDYPIQGPIPQITTETK